MLEEVLSGCTGGMTAVKVFAVAQMKHEEFSSLADLGLGGRRVDPSAGLGVTHEDEQFGGLVGV